MSFISARSKEPSTWAGVSTLVMALFSAFAAWKTGDVATLSASVGALVAGIAAIFMPEKAKAVSVEIPFQPTPLRGASQRFEDGGP